MDFFVEFVLQECVILKLDNCLLISNPLVGQFLCNTVSKLPVQTVLNGSTGTTHHLKSNGFMMSSEPLRSAPRESSPIKMMSMKSFPKSRSLAKNVGGIFFEVVLTIGLTLFPSVDGQTCEAHENQPSFFGKMDMVVFILVVVALSEGNTWPLLGAGKFTLACDSLSLLSQRLLLWCASCISFS